MPALSFALATPDLHVIPAGLLERSQVPAGTEVEKLFWSKSVETLMNEFHDVKELGVAAAEEWIKGLEVRGTENRHDTWRWEKYAASGGVGQMQTLLYPGYQHKQPPQSLVGASAAMTLVGGSGRGLQQENQNAAFSAPPVNAVPGALRSLTSMSHSSRPSPPPIANMIKQPPPALTCRLLRHLALSLKAAWVVPEKKSRS